MSINKSGTVVPSTLNSPTPLPRNPGQQAAAAAPSERAPTETAPAESESHHKGLCVNCDNRDTCAFPRSEAGVWFCEEYA